jgi:hypothetical protein
MGMYTELILGCELKDKTPASVINTLKWMCGEGDKPNDLAKIFMESYFVFSQSSYYFGVNKGHSKLWYDDISEAWHISARCNIKNYDGEIESFLEWLKPHIKSGSGCRDFYAIVCYEEADEPTIHYLQD